MGLNNVSVQEKRRVIALDDPAVVHVKPGAIHKNGVLVF